MNVPFVDLAATGAIPVLVNIDPNTYNQRAKYQRFQLRRCW
jgi:hypothetical protein